MFGRKPKTKFFRELNKFQNKNGHLILHKSLTTTTKTHVYELMVQNNIIVMPYF